MRFINAAEHGLVGFFAEFKHFKEPSKSPRRIKKKLAPHARHAKRERLLESHGLVLRTHRIVLTGIERADMRIHVLNGAFATGFQDLANDRWRPVRGLHQLDTSGSHEPDCCLKGIFSGLPHAAALET